ncbi:MAG: hypothetical protein IT314_00900 [Anaerolineales bacterium]|nr:hypothetical protein [Anaerolineales bacterium]
MSGAEAACSALGSHFDRLNAPPSGWHSESASADFHELRQGFAETVMENYKPV